MQMEHAVVVMSYTKHVERLRCIAPLPALAHHGIVRQHGRLVIVCAAGVSTARAIIERIVPADL
jgi:hypothetical protein